ncbi:MAG: peptidase S9, partial [Muribaculaceae bacterium]|nr:peptidase S9 [Muribaculaceae bacterium]
MNSITKTITMSASAMLLSAAAGATEVSAADAPIIERPDFKSATGIFDIDALEALGRVSAPCVSPDGTRVLYGISYESVPQNKSNNELWTMNIDGSGQTRITHTHKSETSAVWIDGGQRIAFIYPDADGNPQV